MRRIPLDDIDRTAAALHASAEVPDDLRRTVGDVVAEVRRSGDAALREYKRRFDGVDIGEPMAVPRAPLTAALERDTPEVADALRLAAANIRAYHERELPRARRETLAQGQVVGQEIVPLAAAGLYVPGGLADCPSAEAAMEFVNAFAPEHLELHVDEPGALLAKVRNAGAVFVGRHAATAVADYAAGTNHVLPTGGAARYAQGLSASVFVKRVAVMSLDATAAARLAPAAAAIAREEGYGTHALSAELRGGTDGDHSRE